MEYLQKIIKNNKIQHAYLFCGPRGVGKKMRALYFAKSLLCEKQVIGGCGICTDCKRIEGGNHPSVVSIHPDGNAIKIQQVKDLQKKFSYKGIEGTYQIYIMEDADKMTIEASNSILKFLEEPIGDTIAILLSEQPERLVPTIVSRCQLLQFRTPGIHVLEEMYIKKGVDRRFAKIASQIWQDTETVVDMVETEKFATIQKIVVQLTEDIRKNEHHYVLLLDREWFSKKPSAAETEYLVDYMLYWVRDLLIMELGLEGKCFFPTEELQAFRRAFTVDILQVWVSDIMKLKQKLRFNINAQLALEGMLLKMQEELMCTG